MSDTLTLSQAQNPELLRRYIAQLVARLAFIGPDGEFARTIGDSSGTPGDATLNTPVGLSAIAAGSNSITVTNSAITATGLVHAWVQQSAADATLTEVVRTSVAAGSFTIYGNANATADVVVAWDIVST